MDAMSHIAEARIRDAIARGDLDGLPGRGRPLDLEDLSRMDPALRPSYLLLKGQGFAPAELEARRDVLRLEDLLHACGDGRERSALQSDLSRARLRYELLLGRRADTAALDYEERILERLSGCRDRSCRPDAGR